MGLGLTLALSIWLASAIGRMDVGWQDIGLAFLNKIGLSSFVLDRTAEVVIFQIRLSRSVLAGLVGASLAVAGVIFQGLLRNPLADPFTIGVSTGAAFGAALLVVLGVEGAFWGLSSLPLGALAGALLALLAVLMLSREQGRIRQESLVLAGIVVSTFLSALISLMKSLDEESLSAIVFWIMGSFSGRGWVHVGFLLPYGLAGLILAALNARELDILALGEEQSHYLGVAVSRTRLQLLLAASLLTAAAVPVSGVIGFVGLLVPHMMRLLFGADHRLLLPATALFAASFLVAADSVARTITAPTELPVGVITALCGAPFFIYLLRKRTI